MHLHLFFSLSSTYTPNYCIEYRIHVGAFMLFWIFIYLIIILFIILFLNLLHTLLLCCRCIFYMIIIIIMIIVMIIQVRNSNVELKVEHSHFLHIYTIWICTLTRFKIQSTFYRLYNIWIWCCVCVCLCVWFDQRNTNSLKMRDNCCGYKHCTIHVRIHLIYLHGCCLYSLYCEWG